MDEQKTPVVILGAGGYAAVVLEILSARPDISVIGCTDKALGLSERPWQAGSVARPSGR